MVTFPWVALNVNVNWQSHMVKPTWINQLIAQLFLFHNPYIANSMEPAFYFS